MHRLKQDLAKSKRYQRLMALMFLDLDNFKQVNDTLGYIGDELLKVVGGRLQACVRDIAKVCRQYGGDGIIIGLSELPIRKL